MGKSTIIKLENITKDYITGDVITSVLTGISLTINEGDFIAITGRSGSGKSTLMNILGLLDTPTSGTYILNGSPITKFSEDDLSRLRNKTIGFVFQSFNLLPRSTTIENVVLPAIYAGIPQKERDIRAKEILTSIGMEEKMHSRPNKLSGGQQQRVAIARALMNDPALILADEPTGNLDVKSGHDVMEVLKNLNKKGKTIVLITHEADIAQQAKKIIRLVDGRIVK
ncbi:MAG: macrolide ABC transporter ATP-binding protein [Candidatus Levybacteria bacterium CG_4_10_14_0_2_um_filter_36_16]|nr:MAG: macrolide ABC transporter ATP-binding protein [Candidatus Levybacteria bacterium CG2_30_37_29]PIR79597.1 MAG: macrolide ABC transporter ATP-binding protein [Candidatus Levybacteria bacterium CG10_big_fil_rev_8_21_14_0_10_36_30]PIZ97287.1 MAG: macrolide ABC transporter ATP-binding protein [Candidatus Levybacteria bacterium CG_4_10_14_0_2_um_filter_36_16]PJA90582.1 MAG: macrolide ABC transporter ATP-binding protein [Candidatus Levybacteria bacterium CG_4_9_14_3_um_filter_36_7]